MSNLEIKIPGMVPEGLKRVYSENFKKATKGTKNLFLFAGDQKIEHLNKDFYGKNISKDDANPEHLFKIASEGKPGCFATQLGLISKYGPDYRTVNYLVKLNSKTDIIPTKKMEPISYLLNSIDDVVELRKNSKLSIVGVGYTIYLGSEHENEMLATASKIVTQAHQNGLIAVLWIYPRGKNIKDEKDVDLIAGACGIASCLGADFVKINCPGLKKLNKVVVAAGRTGVVCSGGKLKKEETFLKDLYQQIHEGNISGCAVGRNIHQKDLTRAIKFCKAISSIVNFNLSLTDAKKHLK